MSNTLSRRNVLKGAGGFAAVGSGLLIASPASAARPEIIGRTITADVPIRIFDSRPESRIAWNGNKPGANQIIRVTPKNPITDKAALFLNVTVTETEGEGGFITLFPLGTVGDAVPNVSNVNWFGPRQILSNSGWIACNSLGEFKFLVGVNATHVVIDYQAATTVL